MTINSYYSSSAALNNWNGSELVRGPETKRYAACLVLREIACCMPTFFFQNVSQFFDAIFNPLCDLKVVLRVSAARALRAGLVVTVQRETAKQGKHHHIAWYKNCYNAVSQGFMQVG